MINSNYHDFMRVSNLKNIICDLPDDMLVVIPVVNEDDVNLIFGFRKVRTAGIIGCQTESEKEVFCLNGATDGKDIADQIHFSDKDVDVVKILYGKNANYEVEEKTK